MDDGRIYYANHLTKSTQWEHPTSGKRYKVSLNFTKSKKNSKKLDSHSTAMHVLNGEDLSGKVAIVTGANSGIGFETAKALALHGTHVILACRNMNKANRAAAMIRTILFSYFLKCCRPLRVYVEAMLLDLASFTVSKTLQKNLEGGNFLFTFLFVMLLYLVYHGARQRMELRALFWCQSSWPFLPCEVDRRHSLLIISCQSCSFSFLLP
ncbi:unnamed protein product [Pocillopora meandrina]|uniref:WW domain-containing oxidoreductase n=1 Tax=Pocillopora meandrina TaxID=46732 RepID=A0AAU9Y518_9CNID|nr:unnamed protein product [Pocillopora meandrina]